MDTVNVILNEVQNKSGYDLLSILSIIKDVATIIAIGFGIYWGQKGLKKLLLDDIVKNKIADLHKSNKKVVKLTTKIISGINSIDNLNRPATADDLSFLKKHTKSLVDISYGSSKEVATFCFFLNETIKKIEPFVETKTYSEVRNSQDIYSFVSHTCIKINQFSSNIIDIPKRIKLEPYNEINKVVRKYLGKEDLFKVGGIHFGINLDSKSSLSLLFSSIINRTTSGYIYKKQFFQLIESNIPIVYELYVNKIYFPVIIETKDEVPFMGKSTLHLVRFEMKQSILPDNKKYTVIFYYSNLDPTIRFIDVIKLDDLIEKYIDAFLNKNIIIKKVDITITKLADETIEIICDKNIAEKYFSEIKNNFIDKLKKIKKNS